MKKIIIFNSAGGGGHISVTNALQEYLKDQYNIKPVLIFTDTLGPIDPGQIFSFHHKTGEDLYNYFVQRKEYRILNMMYRFGKWYYRLFKRKSQQLITKYLEKHKPDMIISVAPLINNDILIAARKLKIPFLLIPTDLDATSFVYNIKAQSSDQFRIALAFDDKNIKKIVKQFLIPSNLISITGFPIRKDFFEQRNISKIKQEFNIPEKKPVILLLMGAVGSKQTYAFAKQLAKISTPVHILICVGKNKKIGEKIQAIQFPNHITRNIIGYTQRISDFMTTADLFITKSGSVSVCEALYMNLPLLLDGTSEVLLWERFNHTFVQKHNFGEIIKHNNDLAEIVNNLLVSKEKLHTMKKNLETLKKKKSYETIPKLIAEMINK